MSEQLLPTPYVGLPVIWYKDDQDFSDPIAATVTRVEGPGKVSLYYVAHNGMLRHKSGVNWLGNDRRLSPGRPFRANGVWDFLPDLKPRAALKYHKEAIAKREKQEAEARAAREAAERAAREQHEAVKGKI